MPENQSNQSDSQTHAFDAKSFLASCSTRAGVYQMYDAKKNHLYIGKAKNLKKRLSSYFRKQTPGTKLANLVQKIAHIDITITHTETEALILEQNLIKAEHPPFNVLLRDDKSYPYLHISDHQFPRLSYHRGSRSKKGRYFGPFPNSYSVRESLKILQKIFKARQCEDSYFSNRSRPCLQHQIGRCSAPCVDLISEADYAETVRQSCLFLEGKSQELNTTLSHDMERAASDLDFETAAEKRDQIAHLRHIQEQQFIDNDRGDIDIIAAHISNGHACIQLLYIRHGRMLGSKTFYPPLGLLDSSADLTESFISQRYLLSNNNAATQPAELICNTAPSNLNQLKDAIKAQTGKSIHITTKVRAGRARWLEIANNTAQQNLLGHINSRQQIHHRFEALDKALNIDSAIERIECFDISHSSGELTVASCVVFNRSGPQKGDYRKFNIDDITPGDDYAAMRQAVERRYLKVIKGEGRLPDLLLIDGGKGQLSVAQEALQALQLNDILLLGVAKGRSRKPGLETLILCDANNNTQGIIDLNNDSPALHLIQQIRDEAHRFAISGHRARRAKQRKTSPLEGIAGIGAKRRKALLNFFGGWQEVERAGIDDLAKVPGISTKIATDIYTALHNA